MGLKSSCLLGRDAHGPRHAADGALQSARAGSRGFPPHSDVAEMSAEMSTTVFAILQTHIRAPLGKARSPALAFPAQGQAFSLDHIR